VALPIAADTKQKFGHEITEHTAQLLVLVQEWRRT
jgi:hypothetical protein